ncbi:MAG: acyl-CoA dehydrogenase family protein [Streptosporangiaceae bacterium]|jgi:alkylation response protein AidB-like acyl-CoA dehydrogenase
MSTELEDLRDAVRGLVARGGDWKRLSAEIGVAGLAIPESYGGAGAGLEALGIAMSELGRELVPTPMLGSAVLAGQALLGSGDSAACARLLPGIADGSRTVALAWATAAGRWDPAVRSVTADGSALTGAAHYVLDGASADVLLVAADTGLYEIDPAAPGVTVEAIPAMDTTRDLAIVRLDGAPGRRIHGDGALDTALDHARVALAAEQTGAAERALEITVEYAKTRVQFGRPIGSFQALRHRMADMYVSVESARSLWRAAAREPELAASAHSYCSRALRSVAAEMIQIHGAIGVTWEHPAHRYLKRAHGSALLFAASASDGPPLGA